MTTLLAMLNAKGLDITQVPVSAKDFSRLLKLLEGGSINATAAKAVFEEMVESGKAPEKIVTPPY